MGLRVLLLAVLASLATPSCGAEEQSASPKPTPPPPLYLAGDGELWVVDVARASARHVPMPELSPGDPPHRIVRRGEQLVTWGRGGTTVLDPSTLQHTSLARDAWFYIPGAQDDRVWIAVLDEKSPATVNALEAVREVTVDGHVTVPDTEPPEGRWPQLAVAGGLLLATREGWQLWDPSARATTRRWSFEELGLPVAAHGDVLVTCQDPCEQLRAQDLQSGDETTVDAPAGHRFGVYGGGFSPDGRMLALPIQQSEDAPASLALVDLQSATATTIPGSQVPPGYLFARWSRTGEHVFLTGGERFHDRAIVVHRLGDGEARRVPVHVGDFYDAVAL